MSVDVALQGENVVKHFATTRWSLIRNGLAVGIGSGANKDLAQLCQIYWGPIFKFICLRGYSPPDAEDLTQDFFLLILQGTLLQSADPTRGRFRSLLIKSLRNFLIDAQIRSRARKRGGDLQFCSWEESIANAHRPLADSKEALKTSWAEASFDLSWAEAVTEEALRRLQTECESRGRRQVYDVLNHCLTSERGDISYRDLSAALGITEKSVRDLLHQFRRRFRELLRDEVAKTVGSDVDVDDELRYLCATLSARGG